VAAFLAGVAALGAVLLSQHPAEEDSAPAAEAPASAPTGAKPGGAPSAAEAAMILPRPGSSAVASTSGRGAAGKAVATPLPPHTPGRSPLEHSPGYYPPADPESASVRLGRREAPYVSGEFTGGAASLEDLGRAVLDAINARNVTALHELRVTRREFETFLWREFPESRPITNITVDDAWSMSVHTSRNGGSRAVDQFGGRSLRLVRVDRGPTQEFTNFKLIRDVVIVAEGEGGGEAQYIKIVPSVAVRNGRFKALLFRD
jgi:hypothetical protein